MAPSARRTVDYRIDPFDLHLFAAVVDHGSITAAARAVSLSLPAASARIKALEDATGAALLQRSKSGATPTDAGRALARHARRVLAELESLHVEMAGFGDGRRGTLRLLCNTAAMTEALPRALGCFLVERPDLDLDVAEHASDAVLAAVRNAMADVGIVADYVDTAGLVVRPWLDDRLVALLPRRWPGGRRATIAFGELLEHPLVGLPRDSGLSRFLAVQASRTGRVPRHRVRLGSFDALAKMVDAGVGAAVMPESAAARFGAAGTRVAQLTDIWSRRKLLLCTTPQGAQRPGVQALLNALARNRVDCAPEHPSQRRKQSRDRPRQRAGETIR